MGRKLIKLMLVGNAAVLLLLIAFFVSRSSNLSQSSRSRAPFSESVIKQAYHLTEKKLKSRKSSSPVETYPIGMNIGSQMVLSKLKAPQVAIIIPTHWFASIIRKRENRATSQFF